MAGNKYLFNNAGKITEIAANQTSVGAADANKLIALDATGKLDGTLMPVGYGPEIDSIITSEALSAGSFVNTYNNAGVANVRKADGSVSGKEADGFVLAAYAIGATAVVFRLSQLNNQLTGKTPGTKQYLSVTVPGGTQETVPTVAGQIIQILGTTRSATELNFIPHEPIVLA